VNRRFIREFPMPPAPPAAAARVRRGAGAYSATIQRGGCPPPTGSPFGVRARRFFDHRCRLSKPSCPGKTPWSSGLAGPGAL